MSLRPPLSNDQRLVRMEGETNPSWVRTTVLKPLSQGKLGDGVEPETMGVTHNFKPNRLPCALGVAPVFFTLLIVAHLRHVP